MTTACLRDRIPGRPQPGLARVAPELPLLDAPQFIRETFGIRQIEVWTRQLPEETDGYLAEFGRRTAAAGCRLSNIQLDGPYDLSSTDAAERARSIGYVRQWIDRAALARSPRLRINIDGGKIEMPFDPAALAPILRALQDHAFAKKVQLLIENHIGHSKTIANVAALMKVTGDRRIGAVLDWGNTPGGTTEERLADYRQLFPYLAFVSAKGLHFDAAGSHKEYDIAGIVRATEASGFRGIYSIELYTNSDFPDPLVAVPSMVRSIAGALRT